MGMRSILIAASKAPRIRHRTPHVLCRCLTDGSKSNSGKKSDSENKPAPEEDIPVTTFTRVKVVTPGKAIRRSHAPRPPDPLSCCGTGCQNCVWIEYGTKLMHYYSDRPLEEVMDEIDKEVPNIGLREFVKNEIRLRAKYRYK